MRDCIANPLQIFGVEFWRRSEKWLRLQRAPTAKAIISQPTIDFRAADTEVSDELKTLAVLNALNRARIRIASKVV